MKKIIALPEHTCRYFRHGQCAYFFWRVMQTRGRPGLRDYLCLLWKDKLNKIEQFWEVAHRADRFNLSDEQRRKVIAQALAGQESTEITCPDFKQDPRSLTTQCRYYYLQSCLLKFPACTGRCDDYLPLGDQKSSKSRS